VDIHAAVGLARLTIEKTPRAEAITGLAGDRLRQLQWRRDIAPMRQRGFDAMDIVIDA